MSSKRFDELWQPKLQREKLFMKKCVFWIIVALTLNLLMIGIFSSTAHARGRTIVEAYGAFVEQLLFGGVYVFGLAFVSCLFLYRRIIESVA